MNTPTKPATRKYYQYLGWADDYQRSIIWTIMDRSSRGLWTRYTDIDHDAKTQMMSELLRDGRFEIKQRTVQGVTETGRRTYFAEFAV